MIAASSDLKLTPSDIEDLEIEKKITNTRVGSLEV
jgi:hypothetical protein